MTLVAFASIAALVSGLAFLFVYSFYIDVSNPVSNNAFIGALAFTIVALAAVFLEYSVFPHTRVLAFIGFSIGTVIMIWRTVFVVYYGKMGREKKHGDS